MRPLLSLFFKQLPDKNPFNNRHFRISRTLVPAIENLISRAGAHEVFNIVSITCGIALEIANFEILARFQGVKINYFGYDINNDDLLYNSKIFRKKFPSVRQSYTYADLAQSPPEDAIAKANCIIWRHPELLSDHPDTPQGLIVDMCQILWNILERKNERAPLLITCYDPHEMMVIVELLRQLCEEDLKYDLTIDKQKGRASWQNPIIDPEDLDPLFNLNHHDQCQLLITECPLKKLNSSRELFLLILAKAFQNILTKIPRSEQNDPASLIQNLDKPTTQILNKANAYLNNQIRENATPFMKREELVSLLNEHYEQPKLLSSSNNL